LVSRLAEIFQDRRLVGKIERRLSYLFQLAELEASRAGKVGMEVGSLREKILTALLIYKFGEEHIETEIPITEPEVDAKLFGQPISIKSITGMGVSRSSGLSMPKKPMSFLNPICQSVILFLLRLDGRG